jgi:hypothetical protein
MSLDISTLYFETSAVNYLFDNVFSSSEKSSVKTKEFQLKKNRKWYISSITLWELFLTKNLSRRFNLFDFSRCLFFDQLIASPEEIITNYIKSKCPSIEKRYDLASRSLFSNEWTIACKNLNYEFQPERSQIESITKHLRFLGEYFIKTKRGYRLRSFDDFDQVSTKINAAFLKYIFKSLLKIYGDNPSEDIKYYIAVSLQVTLMILCYGIGLDHSTIENFWNGVKRLEPLERLEYTLKTFPDIFFRGPIANISRMIIQQSLSTTGRGLYFDSLHSIYTTYCDLYVSNDQHFLDFKKTNQKDPNMSKVIAVKNMKFFKTE